MIDDVLATGGTARATANLVEALGGRVVGIGVLIELDELGGRNAPRRVQAREPDDLLRCASGAVWLPTNPPRMLDPTGEISG